MWRLNKTEFIDSPDAICARKMGHVNLLCRGVSLAAVGSNASILTSLPYSRWLYEVSTGGRVYRSQRGDE